MILRRRPRIDRLFDERYKLIVYQGLKVGKLTISAKTQMRFATFGSNCCTRRRRAHDESTL
jgi:hypothetical protein